MGFRRAVDNADAGKCRRQFRGAADKIGQRHAAIGRCQCAGVAAAAPIGCLAGSRRRGQFLGKIGCQRLFHAVTDGQTVEDRCVGAAIRAGQQIAECIDFRLQARRHRGRVAPRHQGGLGGRLRFGKGCLGGVLLPARTLGGLACSGEISLCQAGLLLERFQRDGGKRLGRRGKPAFQIANPCRKCLARRGGGTDLGGGIGKLGLCPVSLCADARQVSGRLVTLWRGIVNLCLQGGGFGGKPGDRLVGIAAKAGFARDILAHPLLLAGAALDGVADPSFLAVKLVPGDRQTLIFRRARHLGLAQ